MDRGAWQVILHNIAESQTRQKQLSIRTLAQGKGFGYQGDHQESRVCRNVRGDIRIG